MGFRGLNLQETEPAPPAPERIPPGGATRAVLAKASGADFDLEWNEGYLRTDGTNPMRNKLQVITPAAPVAQFQQQHLVLWHAERDSTTATNAGEAAIVFINQNTGANGGTQLGRITLSRLTASQFEFKNVINENFIGVKAGGFIADGQNQGLLLADYAAVYKVSGGSLILRCPTGDAQPQIEDSNAAPASRRDIIDTRNGDLRYALKSEIPQPLLSQSYRADLSETPLTNSLITLFNASYSIPRGGNSRIKVTLRLNLYGPSGESQFLIQNLASPNDRQATCYCYNPGASANVFDSKTLEFFIDVVGTTPLVILQAIQINGPQVTFLGANGTITTQPQYFSEILIQDLGVR